MTPEHTGIWGKSLISRLRSMGFSDAEIAGNIGVRLQDFEGDAPLVAFDKLAELFERAAHLTGDDLIGFKLAQGREDRLMGLITYVSISSPTVATMLENLALFQRLIGDAIDVDTSCLASDGQLKWSFVIPSSVTRQQYLEFGGVGFIDFLRRVTNRRICPKKVTFRHHRFEKIAPIRQFFGCDVEFGAPYNSLFFKPEDLDVPLATVDSNLHKMLVGFGEQALQQTRTGTPSLAVQVERAIADNPSWGHEEVAKKLGMSQRTLARRLADEGTTFRSVVYAYKDAMARNMLSGSDLQLTEIAFVLGYGDLSAFSTAFKRRQGLTPSRFRQSVRMP